MRDYKKYYSKFLGQNKGKLHLAAHSHHYWPDVTMEAQQQYWLDSAKYVDDKWETIFGQAVPETQKLISEILNISRPEQICFAPNTHEFVVRVLSLFPRQRKIKVLSTDSEFYSFQRQVRRLEEDEAVDVTRIPTEPFETFQERFHTAATSDDYDLIFLSQVFFNSSYALGNLDDFILSLPDEPHLVLDGYHGFMAVPTNLSKIEDRIFYLAGSYKYAQGGEGCCFMYCPPGAYRPSNTGWFAEIGSLSEKKSAVSYALDGMAFAGATIDFTALYRLRSILKLFKADGISVNDIHAYVQELQKIIFTIDHEEINAKNLLMETPNHHGHFLTYKLSSTKKVAELSARLKKQNIITDFREDRLRFGQALYHSKDDYKQLLDLFK